MKKLKEICSDVKGFINDHKKNIIVGTAGLITVIGGCIIYGNKRYKDGFYEGEQIGTDEGYEAAQFFDYMNSKLKNKMFEDQRDLFFKERGIEFNAGKYNYEWDHKDQHFTFEITDNGSWLHADQK